MDCPVTVGNFYNIISDCAIVTCSSYLPDGCQGFHIDNVTHLDCTDGGDGLCDNVFVTNIQDGGTVVCQGEDSCSDSEFTVAPISSYTHVCDGGPSGEKGCAACEFTSFHSLGHDGTLICGRGSACSVINVPLQDPNLCVICAFPESCFGIHDLMLHNDASAMETNWNATTYGTGCGPTDYGKLCQYFPDPVYGFDFDADGLNDCEDDDGDGILNVEDECPLTVGACHVVKEDPSNPDHNEKQEEAS